jgi:hypothetical protein
MSSLSSSSSIRSGNNNKIKKKLMEEENEEDIIINKLKKPMVSSSNNNHNNNHNNHNNHNNYQSDDEDDDDEDESDDDNDENEDSDDEDEDDDELQSNSSGDNLVRRQKDEIAEKREILYQLKRLEDKGYTIPNSYNMQSDLLEMKQEYERIVRDKEIDASVRFQRKMLMAFVTGTEYLNTTYDPFAIKLEGWSEQVHDNLTDYDDIFEELHEKYKSKGKKMAPELRLFISLTGSAFMFHLTSRMFKESAIPGVEEVFKSNPELMKQFQNAAAKQFVYKNSGISDSPQQASNTSQSNSGGGLFGMIGNLFGGLTNTPSFNKGPSMPSMPATNRGMGGMSGMNGMMGGMDKSSNDINSIINNVHSKISTQIDDDNRIETLSISDEEITSIIEDATDINLIKKSNRGGKNKRTLNI